MTATIQTKLENRRRLGRLRVRLGLGPHKGPHFRIPRPRPGWPGHKAVALPLTSGPAVPGADSGPCQ